MNGQDELPVGVCEPSTQKVTELAPEGVENIMDILDAEPNPIECMVLLSFSLFFLFLVARISIPLISFFLSFFLVIRRKVMR